MALRFLERTHSALEHATACAVQLLVLTLRHTRARARIVVDAAQLDDVVADGASRDDAVGSL